MIIAPQKVIANGRVSNIGDLATQTQQNGIDLTIKFIRMLWGTNDLRDYSKRHCDRSLVASQSSDWNYYLEPGVYEILFNEKFDIPNGVAATIHTRSSLVRGGLVFCAGLYDAWFKWEWGGVLHVPFCTYLESNMRIAQIVFHEAQEGQLYSWVYNTTTSL